MGWASPRPSRSGRGGLRNGRQLARPLIPGLSAALTDLIRSQKPFSGSVSPGAPESKAQCPSLELCSLTAPSSALGACVAENTGSPAGARRHTCCWGWANSDPWGTVVPCTLHADLPAAGTWDGEGRTGAAGSRDPQCRALPGTPVLLA